MWWERLLQNYENRNMLGHGGGTDSSPMSAEYATERNVSTVSRLRKQAGRVL